MTTYVIRCSNQNSNLNKTYLSRSKIYHYKNAKSHTAMFGGTLATVTAAFSTLGRLAATDSPSKALKLGGIVGLIGAGITYSIWKHFDNKESDEHKKYHDEQTHNILMQAFIKKGSEGKERITYDEQCQLREMISAKNSIFSDLKPESEERYDMENFYNSLIEQFSSPNSEGGERITYDEQCQLREISNDKMRMLDY